MTTPPPKGVEQIAREMIDSAPDISDWQRLFADFALTPGNGYPRLISALVAALSNTDGERIRRLEEALRPFAKAEWTGLRSAEPGTPLAERDVFEVDGLKIADFDRAREAISTPLSEEV